MAPTNDRVKVSRYLKGLLIETNVLFVFRGQGHTRPEKYSS